MKTIGLLGGGGHASDVLGIIEDLDPDESRYRVLIGDDDQRRPDRFEGRRAILTDIDTAITEADELIVAVGYPGPRRTLAQRAGNTKASPPLVHPLAALGKGVELGVGSVVSGLAWLSPLAHIGRHGYVGYGAKVGHDVVIGDFSSVMPGAFVGGDATIGEGALIGANATVLQGVTVGTDATVGAGATVVDDVPDGETVVGSPAKARRLATNKSQ